jgi:hypothetical protein
MVDYTEERAFKGAGGFELLKGKKFVSIPPFTSPTMWGIETQTNNGFKLGRENHKKNKSMKPFPTFEVVETATKKEEQAWVKTRGSNYGSTKQKTTL